MKIGCVSSSGLVPRSPAADAMYESVTATAGNTYSACSAGPIISQLAPATCIIEFVAVLHPARSSFTTFALTQPIVVTTFPLPNPTGCPYFSFMTGIVRTAVPMSGSKAGIAVSISGFVIPPLSARANASIITFILPSRVVSFGSSAKTIDILMPLSFRFASSASVTPL